LDLRDIKGIGDKLASRIINHFGSQNEFLRAAGNYDVYRLASMEGVSQRRAVEIINAVLGNPTESFLKTERAVQIYEEIIQCIIQYANTEYAKNRVLLLGPGKNQATIQENLNKVMEAKEKVAHLPKDDLRALFKNVNFSRTSKPKYDTSRAILVESRDDYTSLMDRGLNQRAQILNIQEVASLDEFELVVYVYRDGVLELDDAPNLAMVNYDAEDLEIIPETVLSYYHENQTLLENILKIREILGYPSVLRDVLKIMDSIETSQVDETLFNSAVNQAKDKADKKLEEAIKKVDLSGQEVLDILNKGMSPKIQEIFDEILKDAVKEIEDDTRVNFDPFIQKYPLEIDEQELERVKRQEIGKKEVKAFEERVNVAAQLQLLKSDVEVEIQEVLEFDYQFTLGCFAYYYDLHPPMISDGFRFKEGLHLNLALEDPSRVQRINYSLESPDNVVLLTGANSGGKTTLLETLAQISIMSQMGLPVVPGKPG